MTRQESIDSYLNEMLGRTRARKLRLFVERSGLSVEFFLRLGMDLVELHAPPPPKKNEAAVTMGVARWRKMPSDARSKLARMAVNARWAKYRERMAREVAGKEPKE